MWPSYNVVLITEGSLFATLLPYTPLPLPHRFTFLIITLECIVNTKSLVCIQAHPTTEAEILPALLPSTSSLPFPFLANCNAPGHHQFSVTNTLIEVLHRTKSWPNSGSENEATKKGHILCLSYYAPLVGVEPMFSNPRTWIHLG